MKVVKFQPDSGRIESVSSYPGMLVYDHPYFAQGVGLAVDGGVDVSDLLHFVQDGAIVERPASPAVLDGLLLRQLPVPSTITIDGVAYPCTDDYCELSFALPGVYQISVSAWPYHDAYFEVSHETAP